MQTTRSDMQTTRSDMQTTRSGMQTTRSGMQTDRRFMRGLLGGVGLYRVRSTEADRVEIGITLRNIKIVINRSERSIKEIT